MTREVTGVYIDRQRLEGVVVKLHLVQRVGELVHYTARLKWNVQTIFLGGGQL